MLGKYINHCEDSLTASVISHLLHLPSELFWRILRKACLSNDLPEYSGEIKGVEYWPQWPADGTENIRIVVPDVFLRFADFDLIIEAKRRDATMQDRGQWVNEIKAYHNEHGKSQKLFVLALGGIANEADEDVYTIKIVKCKWIDLLHVIKSYQKELDSLTFQQHQQAAHQRVLADVIDLLYWHGISGRWFKDFEFNLYKLGHSETSQEILYRIKEKMS